MASPEILLYLKSIPGFWNRRSNMKSIEIRTHTKYSLYTSNHDCWSSSCEPVYMWTSKVWTCFSFSKLSIAVRLKSSYLCSVILCGRSIFNKILKSSVSMSFKCLSKNYPTLWLWEYSCILFSSRIVYHCECSVECVCMIWRIHKNGAILGIESFIYHFKSLISLLITCKSTYNSPALWVEPHICLRIITLSDNLSIPCKSTDKSVLVPAKLLNDLSEFFLALIKICDIFIIFLIGCKLF